MRIILASILDRAGEVYRLYSATNVGYRDYNDRSRTRTRRDGKYKCDTVDFLALASLTSLVVTIISYILIIVNRFKKYY